MDLLNALYVVLAVLISLVLADLLLMALFSLMDLVEPNRVKTGWTSVVNWVTSRAYLASDLWSHARRSKG